MIKFAKLPLLWTRWYVKSTSCSPESKKFKILIFFGGIWCVVVGVTYRLSKQEKESRSSLI